MNTVTSSGIGVKSGTEGRTGSGKGNIIDSGTGSRSKRLASGNLIVCPRAGETARDSWSVQIQLKITVKTDNPSRTLRRNRTRLASLHENLLRLFENTRKKKLKVQAMREIRLEPLTTGSRRRVIDLWTLSKLPLLECLISRPADVATLAYTASRQCRHIWFHAYCLQFCILSALEPSSLAIKMALRFTRTHVPPSVWTDNRQMYS
ncbi:hypothetical protein EVAR_87307_1 [Eumeta japonica]|uniref:Uncharacterized protein n=1 Tax=Eumeta variegata TaxID=151549 RepID=A0A4C1VYL2_EUMVA|nr:hypothetical protein EVAR_87307_1 [Eumeta japonica]